LDLDRKNSGIESPLNLDFYCPSPFFFHISSVSNPSCDVLLDDERVTIFPGLFHASENFSSFNSNDRLAVLSFHLIARQKLTNSSGCVYIQAVVGFVVR